MVSSGDIGEHAGGGFAVFRASRLDALVDPLREMLAATRPDDPLVTQTIIAAHPGIKPWLVGELARRDGAQGIAANIEVRLPSEWIDAEAQAVLRKQAVALPNYAQSRLRWTLDAILAQGARYAIRGAALDACAAHGGDDAARRRFQLADRLAALYSRYLVYRPDWLAAWEAGKVDFVAARRRPRAAADLVERELLAPLWREAARRLGAHRGRIVEDLVRALRTSDLFAVRQAVHLFGVAHLAPAELRVFAAAAQTRQVALYVPDPCREYWGELDARAPALRARLDAETARVESAGDADFWSERGHPLLSRWGRLGQHFVFALAGLDLPVFDVRHWRDTQPAPARGRLERVQQSLRDGNAGTLAVALDDDRVIAAECADASLRVHACHTRLRELEVLRDALLDATAAAARDGVPLKPSQIVVMAPDMGAYAALIPAVFGAPGEAQAALPYHLADVPASNAHPLLAAFRRVLDLPDARLTAPEVADLVSVPETARRLGIEGDGVERLLGWLRASRVAWGFDAAHRARLGAPPIAAHTFAWAADRLLAGYVMDDGSEDDAALLLADGAQIAPLPGIEGPAAAYAGALDALLRDVHAFCAATAQARPASEWAGLLEALVAALFRIDPADRAAREAHAMLLRFLRDLVAEPASVGLDPVLPFAVVRDLIGARLDGVPERQRFLAGGVTFCGMVPRRAIPFRVIAVLGLDEGAFPRHGDNALDLMLRHRRIGDRDLRSDDRYLFLETLMAARERLHLSYIGMGVRDGRARNPAAPVAELLDALDPSGKTEVPWLVRHPLQPFNARYFDASDPRLFSYSAVYAAADGDGAQALAPFHAAPDEPGGDVRIADVVGLGELRDFYKEPARQVLRGHLRLRLDALDDERLREDEPMEARFEAIDRVATRLFFGDGLPPRDWPPVEAPAWLRLGGLLPPGLPGEMAWRDEVQKVTLLREAFTQVALFDETVPPQATSVAIDVHVAATRIAGSVAQVFAGRDAAGHAVRGVVRAPAPRKDKGRIVRRPEDKLSFRERVPYFLDWALLRLQLDDGAARIEGVRLVVLSETQAWADAINVWDATYVAAAPAQRAPLRAQLEARVVALVRAFARAQQAPPAYFPRTSFAVVDAPGASAAATAASRNWRGDRFSEIVLTGERDYAPGYNALLAGEWSFGETAPETAALVAFARRLATLIDIEAPLSRAQDA